MTVLSPALEVCFGRDFAADSRRGSGNRPANVHRRVTALTLMIPAASAAVTVCSPGRGTSGASGERKAARRGAEASSATQPHNQSAEWTTAVLKADRRSRNVGTRADGERRSIPPAMIQLFHCLRQLAAFMVVAAPTWPSA
jgi:hypothetical protein